MPRPLPRSDDHAELCLGEAVTLCCGAFATFHDSTLCCKVCWAEVGLGEPARRLHSLIDPDGLVRYHWRCTEAEAVRFATRYAQPGDLLTGPTGRIVETGEALYVGAFA